MRKNCVHLFLYFELLSIQLKLSPSVRLFHQVQAEIVDQCSVPLDLDHFEHYANFFRIYMSLEYFVIQYSHSNVLYNVDQNGNCYYWPLHLITGFLISIVPSVVFHRFPSQKDIVFYNGTSHCSEFIEVHIWAGSGILFPTNLLSLYRIRLGFSIGVGVYDRRTIVRRASGIASLLSIIHWRFRSSN